MRTRAVASSFSELYEFPMTDKTIRCRQASGAFHCATWTTTPRADTGSLADPGWRGRADAPSGGDVDQFQLGLPLRREGGDG